MHNEFESIPKQLHVFDEENFKLLRAELLQVLPQELSKQNELLEFLVKSFQLSNYLKTCALKDPLFFQELLHNGFEESFKQILANVKILGLTIDTEAELMSAVRIAKRQVALLCGIADLGGWWNGDRVTSALSDFAKSSLSACLDFVLLQNHHQEKLVLADIKSPQEESGFIILGMG